MTESHPHLQKIVLIGDASVGKTSLLGRYKDNRFPETVQPTIGVCFATKNILLKNGGTVKAQIWDTAG